MTDRQPTARSTGGDLYRKGRWAFEVLVATPPDVWKQYRADGYTTQQAIDEELSYAE